MNIGIEIECLLHPYTSPGSIVESWYDGAVRCLDSYQKVLKPGYPQMRIDDFEHAGHQPAHISAFGWILNKEDPFEDEDSCKSFVLNVSPTNSPLMKGEGPVEFISPVLEFHASSTHEARWREYTTELFRSINYFARMNNPQTIGDTATHVHISPIDGWTIDRIKNICRSILWFEEAFEELTPSFLRQDHWTFSNSVDNPQLRGLDLLTCFSKVRDCTTKDDIIYLMNALDTSLEPDSQRKLTSRYWAWNLGNLKDGEIQTIEYRRAPRVINPQDCLMWVEFAASFAYAAMRYGSEDCVKSYKRMVDGLRQFINQAYESDFLDAIFMGKSGSKRVLPATRSRTSEAIQRARDQAYASNLAMDISLRSPPSTSASTQGMPESICRSNL